MSTIQENLQIIADSTSAIKQAIIDKGGEITGDITTWAESINDIPTSSGGSHCEMLICRCNFPNPRTGDPNYSIAVFSDVLEGDTWADHVNQMDISEKFTIVEQNLPDGRTTLSILGDYGFGPDQYEIDINDVINTSCWYDFIYG